MRFYDWLNNIINAGLLCGNYQDKTLDAKSKLHLMDIVLDANGASYLCEMQANGFELPYETIHREFHNYINGKYKANFRNEKGHGYSSCIYCEYDGDIDIDTTSTTLLGCRGRVILAPYSFVQLYLDKNCNIDIVCPETSRAKVDYWTGAVINIDGNGRIDLNEHQTD